MIRRSTRLLPIARGLALFFALFTLLNLAGSWVTPGFDANLWWIDLRLLPGSFARFMLALSAMALLCFAAGLSDHVVIRRFVIVAIAVLPIALLFNSISFYGEWFAGRIQPGMPVPLSLILCLATGFIFWSAIISRRRIGSKSRMVLLMTFFASALFFPLAQMICFGETDYRRKADAIVVFGARAYADGTPSWILLERTQTAVELYHANLAPELIFSGGPGDGSTSEPRAMRRIALSMGVPDSAIVLDEHGLNTDLTVTNTAAIFEAQHLNTVMAVSHFYHLPRVKMAYARTLSGKGSRVQVVTVPAEENARLPNLPWYVGREVAACWVYYLRPLVRE